MPKLLNITHRVPYPPDKGDRIRNYHVLKQLATIADVSLIALADEPVPRSTLDVLTSLCQRVEIVPVGRVGQLARRGIFSTERRKFDKWGVRPSEGFQHD